MTDRNCVDPAVAAAILMRAQRANQGLTQQPLADAAAIGRKFLMDPNLEGRDYAATFTDLLAKKDFEFAIKMLADYASASLKAGRPLLQRNPQLNDSHWSAALAGITNYTARRLNQASPTWSRHAQPLQMPWMPADSYRIVREPMKQLTKSETPGELAALNVFIRERSLATV